MAEEVAPLTHGAPLENRAREDLEAEPPADGEPTPDSLITEGPEEGMPGGLSHDDIELRSEIARHLRPSVFPAGRDALLIIADEEGASDAVLGLLATLPREVEFHQVSEVWRALGGAVEHRDEGRRDEPVEVGEPVEVDVLDEIERAAPPDELVEGPVVADVIEVVEVEVVPEATADEVGGPGTEAPTAAAPTPQSGREPSATAPGCNLGAIAAGLAVEAGGAVVRRIRRALPLG